MNQCLPVVAVEHIIESDYEEQNGHILEIKAQAHQSEIVEPDVHTDCSNSTDNNKLMVSEELVNDDLSDEELQFESRFCDQQYSSTEEVINFFDEQLPTLKGDNCINYNFPRTFVFVQNCPKSQNDFQEIILDSNNCKVAAMQSSLFKNVPPTIYFGMEDEKILHVQPGLQQQMIWRLSTITPYLIRKIVVRSGFRLIKQTSTSTKWIGTWCKHLSSSMYADLLPNQRVNHFPGSFNFGRKDRLWWNLSALGARMNRVELVNFHPLTFTLPNEIGLLKQQMDNNPDMKLILKPPASARGNGITIVNKLIQIPKPARTKRKFNTAKTALVAQKYIENPLLLFNQTKFDIRMYVLVTSFNPLRMYVYDDGLIRFASVQYSHDSTNLNDHFMHLTNYSINKNSSTYQVNEDENSLNGHKWTLKRFFAHVAEKMPHVCLDKLCEQITDLLLKTVIACQNPVSKLVKQHLKAKYNSYELLGFDIMLDSDWKPWLIEVNISPSLRSESSVDTFVKGQLIKDMFNIVGYRLPIPYEDDLLNYELTEEEKSKQRFFAEQFNQMLDPNNVNLDYCVEYDFGLTNQLTPDDVRHLCLAEDELTRKGNFKRLFPSRISQNYLQYFAEPHYHNYLLNEWNRKYGNDRKEGIERLRSLCNQDINLQGIKGKMRPNFRQ